MNEPFSTLQVALLLVVGILLYPVMWLGEVIWETIIPGFFNLVDIATATVTNVLAALGLM